MLLCSYFQQLYPYFRAETYSPSRKNCGILVLRILVAAGSTKCSFRKGNTYTSGDVPLERKLFDGSKTMSRELKDSFAPFDVKGLAEFYLNNIDDSKLIRMAAAFGIPPSPEISKIYLCKALSLQLKSFVDSDMEDNADIVFIEYQKLLAEPQNNIQIAPQASVLYPGDNIRLRSKYRPVYDVGIYEKFIHTWSFENVGTQTWRGRRLYFSNCGSVRPKAEFIYIDIPELSPSGKVDLSVEIDPRGFEDKTKCEWIMVDGMNNDCFPNSEYFMFVVNARYEYKKVEE